MSHLLLSSATHCQFSLVPALFASREFWPRSMLVWFAIRYEQEFSIIFLRSPRSFRNALMSIVAFPLVSLAARRASYLKNCFNNRSPRWIPIHRSILIKQRLQDEKVEKLTENVTQIVFVTSSSLTGVCV